MPLLLLWEMSHKKIMLNTCVIPIEEGPVQAFLAPQVSCAWGAPGSSILEDGGGHLALAVSLVCGRTRCEARYPHHPALAARKLQVSAAFEGCQEFLSGLRRTVGMPCLVPGSLLHEVTVSSRLPPPSCSCRSRAERGIFGALLWLAS